MDDTPVKIALVSHDRRHRRFLAKTLHSPQALQLVAEFEGFTALSARTLATTADLVVLYLASTDCHRQVPMLDLLCDLSDCMKVILVGECQNEEHVAALLRTGAHGYVLNERADQELPTAIESVLRGRRFISMPILDAMAFRFIDRENDTPSCSDADST
ncbi:MAG: response regulator transcription factor [Phycisphaerae bacterium]|nr:response regulator transcription factor [Phycisphaerae bacterium]